MKNFKYVILLLSLTRIAWIDGKERRISNKDLRLLFWAVFFFIPIEAMGLMRNLKLLMNEAICGCLIGGGVFLFTYCLAPKSLGAGDVKLMAVLGCYLGSDMILYTAFFSLNYAAMYLLVKQFFKAAKKEMQVPFAPFVFAGVITVMFIKNEWG